jgi:hypothetical protein
VTSEVSTPRPNFSVLDVVEVHWPGISADRSNREAGEGIVTQVRDYGNGRYRYEVGGESELAGIVDEDMLTATGRRATTDPFWSGPLRIREIVKVSRKYPKKSLRGWYGVVTGQCEGPATVYAVTFKHGPFAAKTRIKDIDARYLKPTGERLLPQPVPYPVTHYDGNGKRGMKPAHGFTVLDEIDQYL